MPIQYICCSHRRMMQAAHWNEDNYRHYVAAFQHYTRIVARQIESVLEALYSTPAGKIQLSLYWQTTETEWGHTAW